MRSCRSPTGGRTIHIRETERTWLSYNREPSSSYGERTCARWNRGETGRKNHRRSQRQHLTFVRQSRRTHEDESQRSPPHNRKQSGRWIDRRLAPVANHFRILVSIGCCPVHTTPPAT